MAKRSNRAPGRPAKRADARPRTMLVLGLGNPLLGDDSVGLQVVRRLRPQLSDRPGVAVDEDYCGGLRLMERLVGFDRAILVDAVCSGGEPGTVRILSADALPTRHSASAHDVDLPTALALGRKAGAALPADQDIRLVTIEATEVLTFSEECTAPVRAGLDRATEVVLELLAAAR